MSVPTAIQLEIAQSAPGNGRIPAAADGCGGGTLGPPPPNPGGFRFCKFRMTLNGVTAC
jgi:hypothetical protein